MSVATVNICKACALRTLVEREKNFSGHTKYVYGLTNQNAFSWELAINGNWKTNKIN